MIAKIDRISVKHNAVVIGKTWYKVEGSVKSITRGKEYQIDWTSEKAIIKEKKIIF
jgi:hypothetical protein